MEYNDELKSDNEIISEGAEFKIHVHYGEKDLCDVIVDCIEKYKLKLNKY